MRKHILMACLLAAPTLVVAANAAEPGRTSNEATQERRLSEADRTVAVGRILLKWGGYVEKVEGQDRRSWGAAMWPSLAAADLDNLQSALRAVTYEGMRNAVLGQRPYDSQVIDRLARSEAKAAPASNPVTKALGSLAADLVFTPISPCRIVDTRVTGARLGAGTTRNLDASNVTGNFTAQGGVASNCGIPANPAALALSVTGLNNTTTGYIRLFPFNGSSAQGSPVPLNTVNTTATNDIIVPACQGCTQELKVFSTADTHYSAFVTGYFMAPVATALECVEVRTAFSIAPNALDDGYAYCPAGYTVTGAGCDLTLDTTRIHAVFPERAVNGVYCQAFNNEDAVATTSVAIAACCRVPGR